MLNEYDGSSVLWAQSLLLHRLYPKGLFTTTDHEACQTPSPRLLGMPAVASSVFLLIVRELSHL